MDLRPLTQPYIDSVTIPSKIAPLPSQSTAIKKLLKKREKNHKAIVSYIQTNYQKINYQIEEEIAKSSDFLNEQLARIKDNIDNKIKIIDSFNGENIINLSEKILKNVESSVKIYNKERYQFIEEYYESVKNFEKKRSELYRVVLKQAYKEMSKVSHLLPYQLMHYFEYEILNFNQITMNNYRFYAYFYFELKQRIQEEIRMFNLKITDVCKKMTDSKNRPVDSSPTDDLVQSDSKISITWSKQVKLSLDYLDSESQKLINAYKSAVIHIFNRFFHELKTVFDDLRKEDDNTPQPSLVVDSNWDIIKDIAKIQSWEIVDLQNLWMSIIETMEQTIENNYSFLQNVTHLWDDHFLRLIDINELIFQELKLLIDKHNKEAASFDTKKLKIFDQLRQDSNLRQLDLHLKQANQFLDSVGKLYTNQCDNEIKQLKKYQNLFGQEIDLLISEIDRFLQEFSKDENILKRRSIWKTDDDENEDGVEINENDNLISNEIKACQYQVDAVNNWMFGLWEAIRLYMSSCRNELLNQADFSINNVILKLKKRLEVRLEMHKPRYQRVKVQIYDVRHKELEEHALDFKRMENIINNKVENSKNDLENELFEEISKKIKEIEKKLKNATKKFEIMSYIEKMKSEIGQTKEKMAKSFEQKNQEVEENQNFVQGLICEFFNSIRLFSEGGNYSRDEVKILKKKITKIQKQSKKKFTKILDNNKQKQNDILSKFLNTEKLILDRLRQSKEEFEFNEQICEKIKNLQSKIRKVAYDIKFKIYRVNTLIDYYQEIAKIDLWKSKHIELMKKALEDCLIKMKDLTDILTEGYLINVNELMENTLKQIEQTAKSFYSMHKSIINQGKVRENLGELMEEVGKTFDGFRMQVEVHRIECFQELVKTGLRILDSEDKNLGDGINLEDFLDFIKDNIERLLTTLCE